MTTITSSPSVAVWNAWEEDGRSYHMLTDTELEQFTLHFPIRCGHVAVMSVAATASSAANSTASAATSPVWTSPTPRCTVPAYSNSGDPGIRKTACRCFSSRASGVLGQH